MTNENESTRGFDPEDDEVLETGMWVWATNKGDETADPDASPADVRSAVHVAVKIGEQRVHIVLQPTRWGIVATSTHDYDALILRDGVLFTEAGRLTEEEGGEVMAEVLHDWYATTYGLYLHRNGTRTDTWDWIPDHPEPEISIRADRRPGEVENFAVLMPIPSSDEHEEHEVLTYSQMAVDPRAVHNRPDPNDLNDLMRQTADEIEAILSNYLESDRD